MILKYQTYFLWETTDGRTTGAQFIHPPRPPLAHSSMAPRSEEGAQKPRDNGDDLALDGITRKERGGDNVEPIQGFYASLQDSHAK